MSRITHLAAMCFATLALCVAGSCANAADSDEPTDAPRKNANATQQGSAPDATTKPTETHNLRRQIQRLNRALEQSKAAQQSALEQSKAAQRRALEQSKAVQQQMEKWREWLEQRERQALRDRPTPEFGAAAPTQPPNAGPAPPIPRDAYDPVLVGPPQEERMRAEMKRLIEDALRRQVNVAQRRGTDFLRTHQERTGRPGRSRPFGAPDAEVHELETRIQRLEQAIQLLDSLGMQNEIEALAPQRERLQRKLEQQLRERAEAGRARDERRDPGLEPLQEIRRALDEMRHEIEGLRHDVNEVRELLERKQGRAETGPTQYGVETSVIKTGKGGRQVIVARPRIRTPEGVPAHLTLQSKDGETIEIELNIRNAGNDAASKPNVPSKGVQFVPMYYDLPRTPAAPKDASSAIDSPRKTPDLPAPPASGDI